MVKAYSKTVLRTFKNNIARFIGNFMIALFSILIAAGLGALPGVFEASFAENYSEGNAPDIIVKSITGKIDESSLEETLKEIDGIKDYQTSMNLDINMGDDVYYRFHLYSFKDISIGKGTLLDGTMPSSENEILCQHTMMEAALHEFEIGESFDMVFENIDSQIASGLSMMGADSSTTFEVTGIYDSPLYNSVMKEQAMIEQDEDNLIYVKAILYYDVDNIPEMYKAFYSPTDLYMTFDTEYDYFSSSYKNYMNEKKEEILKAFGGEDKVSVLTLEENTSYATFKSYCDKIRAISIIFPAVFVVICALLNSIIISRLIKDERAQIACLTSIGVSKTKIAFKYAIFSLVSISLGVVAGYLLGSSLLPIVVLPAFESVYQMHGCGIEWLQAFGLFTGIAVIVVAVIITFLSAISYLKEKPSDLMKEKTPKPGKKILLEKIPFLWKHISFSFKSSFRNIFRQKKNTLLTTLAIIGSTLLVFLGFGLMDVSNALKDDDVFGNVASSMTMISFVIVLLAFGMTITIIYSLASMNIQDRQRELATLKVLGYHESECSLYTFREIIIIALFSDLLGLPVGWLFMKVALDYLNFGSVNDIKWYTYIITYFVVIVITVIANLLLVNKVKKVDMNSSLKALD